MLSKINLTFIIICLAGCSPSNPFGVASTAPAGNSAPLERRIDTAAHPAGTAIASTERVVVTRSSGAPVVTESTWQGPTTVSIRGDGIGTDPAVLQRAASLALSEGYQRFELSYGTGPGDVRYIRRAPGPGSRGLEPVIAAAPDTGATVVLLNPGDDGFGHAYDAQTILTQFGRAY